MERTRSKQVMTMILNGLQNICWAAISPSRTMRILVYTVRQQSFEIGTS